VIVKNRSLTGEHWVVSTGNITGTGSDFLVLSATSALQSSGQFTVAPGSSTFTVATAPNVNGNTNNYIAYCFNNVDGHSKSGMFIGNGSNDGSFVHVGFRPSVVILKSTANGSGNWIIWDDAMNPYNDGAATNLFPNLNVAAAENDYNVPFLSNGFMINTSSPSFNGAGHKIFYMAFADTPFKNTTAH
jgi:hypothetical protein